VSAISQLLEGTGLFEVFPSQANYLLCRCIGFSAEDLAKHLLEKHGIFIKDLSGKHGIDGTAWVRLAVRSRIDNEKLVQSLPIKQILGG
jgi:histidinol-phosphate/aromatic aminotransferase/cobyric acid decarboxylase-like protein